MDSEPACLREHAIASLIVIDGEWVVPWKPAPVSMFGLRLIPSVRSDQKLALIRS